ncbi:MAG: hypothetical protein ACK56F_06040 [bacterium]
MDPPRRRGRLPHPRQPRSVPRRGNARWRSGARCVRRRRRTPPRPARGA